MDPFVPVTTESSPTGRWSGSGLHHWVTATHCTLLGLPTVVVSIQTIWQVEVFDRSSKPWRCGLQITTNQFLDTSLHFLLGYWALSSPVVLSTVKKGWQKFQQADVAPWHFFRLSVFREDQFPDISRSSPVI